jgi:hypothetical protein
MSLTAAGGPQQENGAHDPAWLPGLHLDALKKAEDGIGGLGLAYHMGAPTPRDMFEPGASRSRPQSDPFFGIVLDAYARLHGTFSPRISSFASPVKTPGVFAHPLSSAGSTANMRIPGNAA